MLFMLGAKVIDRKYAKKKLWITYLSNRVPYPTPNPYLSRR